MSIDTTTDLEPLQKLEDMLVRWLKAKDIPWVYDANSTRKRIYRGFENEEVAQNQADRAVPYPEGLGAVSTEPSEGAESSIYQTPGIVVSCERAEAIGPDFCGNWEVMVSIEVASNNYSSSHTDHRSRVNDVLKLVATDGIKAELQDFDPDFDVSKIVFTGLTKRFGGQDTWVTELSLIFRHYTTRFIPLE